MGASIAFVAFIALQGDKGDKGDTGPQGIPGACPPRPTIEYAYIYSTIAQAILAGNPIPLNQNGLTSGGISHSTAINNEEIHINVTGIYEVQFSVASDSPIFAAIAVNSVMQPQSEYATYIGGTVLMGMDILALNAGDIATIVNYNSTTLTLVNIITANPRVSASVLIHQIA